MCVDAPCAKACPADTKPDKFLRQMRFENSLGAAETILDSNALGGICGSVCPVSRLCESACTRKAIDGPVKIGAVQQYLHKHGVSERIDLPPVPPPTGHRAAVVGAGPAGLSAARELARRGSTVTVFEKRPEAGGALRYALSPLRVSHEMVDEEVSRIQKMGVRFEYNAEVSDISTLMTQGFDAIFVSPGLQMSRPVSFEKQGPHWSSGDNITGALAFLDSANSASKTKATLLSKDRNIVIIGGGSVAMDCAITAKSLGAKTIHIVAREKIDQLPADEDEIKLARNIGAVFHSESEVIKASGDDVVSIVNIAEKRPVPFGASLAASTIIVAAGQKLDPAGAAVSSGSATSTKKENDRGALNAVLSSSGPILVAGGDAIRGGGDTV
jgi:dihydropyrimidine dehydrogenase (NAD+) subunit PreT